MFIFILVVTVLLAYKFGDWRHWEKYQATMFFFALGNLFYNFVYHDHFLWQFRPDESNHHIMEIIYTFTVFPLTVLMLLTNYPRAWKWQVLRVGSYVLIYFTTEFILFRHHRIVYHFGWNIWWSLLWDCIMFPLFVLHYKKPLYAIGLVVVLIFVMNWIFPYRLT